MKRKSGGLTNAPQYIPIFPKKYTGSYPIYYRSSWEKKFMRMLDHNPDILQWSSESVVIPYYDKISERFKRYFPDFYIKTKDGTKWIVEIKPEKETKLPSKKGRKKNLIYQQLTYERNQAKWKAAIKFCDKLGFKFKILTERNLFK